MQEKEFESTLIVFQNAVAGCEEAYDDWYTNIHTRDAMRLDSALGVQRFVAADEQLELDGKRVSPTHWAHTIYEWNDAAKCVQEHMERLCTPTMEVTRDGNLTDLRESFGRPEYLSHGWSEREGFRRGESVLTAMIKVQTGQTQDFIRWFRDTHAPAVLALPGFESAALFSLHEVQLFPQEISLIAHYGLSDRSAALRGWQAAYRTGSPIDLASRCEYAQVTCWKARADRLRPRDVAEPTTAAAGAEARARAERRANFMTRAEMNLL